MILTIEQIQETVRDYFKDKPVKRAYLFGSYARNEAESSSDVDLLVDLDYEKKIGLNFFSWHEDLEEKLQTKVDVISSGGLSKYLSPFIHKDKKLIYERQYR
jgi:predicted nucleotidyltransferase